MIDVKAMMFIIVVCVTSGDGYEEGKAYPMMGWNNGMHILRTDERGDVVDGLFQTGGYGEGLFNNYDNSGKPSFDFADKNQERKFWGKEEL